MLSTVGLQILSLSVATIFGGLVSYIVAQNKAMKAAKVLAARQGKVYGNAIHVLIKSEISREWGRLKAQGFMYDHELEVINALYIMYVEMGGNGAVKRLMAELQTLEIRPNGTGPSMPESFHSDMREYKNKQV